MATKSVENRPPSGAAVPGSGSTGSRACGQREAQRRKPLASMIALHTDDMWQSVRCYPNGPGNRSSRQGTGPSAEGPFLRRGALPVDTGYSCCFAPLSLQRGYPATIGSWAVFYTPKLSLSSPSFSLFCPHFSIIRYLLVCFWESVPFLCHFNA